MARQTSFFSSAGIQPDPLPHLPIERGPKKKGVGQRVPRDKHHLLAEYLFSTRHAWKKDRWKHRVFIDPFCATGRIQVRAEAFTRDGGAVVAWRESVAGGFPFTHMFVADLNEESARACEARLHALNAPAKVFLCPAEQTTPAMVSEVPPDPSHNVRRPL